MIQAKLIVRIRLGLLSGVAMLAFTGCVSEHPVDPRASILLSPDSLAAHLDDPDLVLLHVGDSAAYLAEHIPGARWITRDAVSRPRSEDAEELTLELPDPVALQEVLRRVGISDDSRVVVYFEGNRLSRATRILFTLEWAGLWGRVALLDGGLDAWKASGLPLTNEVPTVEPGNVTVRPRDDLVVDASWVEAHAATSAYALVDGRAREFFVGEREDRGKAGHIPGAGSLPGTELTVDSLRLQSPEELTRLFQEAGVEPGDTVVAYCHIGQFATLVMFAAQTLGHAVKLYDGAFQDWALRDLPVDTVTSVVSR